jgi:peptidoglycan hydrolase CwlO-like protein
VQTQPRVNKINWQELYEAAHSDLETYKAVLEDVSAQLSTLRGEYATLKSQNESLNAQNDCLWKRVNNNQKILEDRVRWLERQNKELLSINKMMSNIYGPKSCKGVYDKW